MAAKEIRNSCPMLLLLYETVDFLSVFFLSRSSPLIETRLVRGCEVVWSNAC